MCDAGVMQLDKPVNFDLFGQPIVEDVLLRDKFVEPPFSVLDTRNGSWQKRRGKWMRLGIKSFLGREGVETFSNIPDSRGGVPSYTSTFDPALCELMYTWFCPQGGSVLDPFAGGSVRGVVAQYLGYQYTGVDIRLEQVEENQKQALEIFGSGALPLWITGNSNTVLDELPSEFDMIFSCPPYADLEVYSDLAGDVSNMDYPNFLTAYGGIIAKSCRLLRPGGYAVFVVGEVRNKHGYYVGFVSDTVRAFERCGVRFYNDAVLINCVNTASLRAERYMRSKKLAKIHQNVLVFKKPDPAQTRKAPQV